MRALGSAGCASLDNAKALNDLLSRHPRYPIPQCSGVHSTPPSISVDPEAVLSALKSFPRGSSPGGSRLRVQHLLSATSGSSAPVSSACLADLTLWINTLLAGRVDVCVAPWLASAPLIALPKKNGSFRPIAVGEVICRLASRLCCLADQPQLPDIFLPYNQVGVGIRGGLEAAVHCLRQGLSDWGLEADLCSIIIDMQNALNECNRSTFLHRLHSVLPELEAWVRWCYCCAGELHFGPHQLRFSAGVQQGDPLCPPLFSLVLLDLLDQVGQIEGLRFSVWYLDDGTFIGPRSSMVSLVDSFQQLGSTLGLHLNLSKCEIFWPTGDQSFPEFPPEMCRLSISDGGVDLLGSPILGSEDFTEAYVLNKV